MDNQFLSVEPKKDTSITTKRQIERGAVSKAIYMVTDLFEDGEPLKLALRNAAVDILKDKGIGYTSNLKSLLILSKEIGYISQINTDILIRAINSIEEGVQSPTQNMDISNILKMSPENEIGVVSKAEVSSDSPEQAASSKIEESTQPEDEVSRPQQVNEKTAVVPTPIKKNEKPAHPSTMATTLDIGTRRKKILEVVRSKGQATIHEFIQSIQGCSSKTIQRELTSLVLSGTLKKTGERRWSKYSLR